MADIEQGIVLSDEKKDPNKKVLGTFRIRQTDWENFGDKVKAQGLTASEVLVRFVNGVIAGDELPAEPSPVTTALPANVATTQQIETAIAAMESRLMDLIEKKL